MYRLSLSRLILLAFLGLFLGSSVLPFLEWRGSSPDPFLLLLFFYAFRVDWKGAPLLALLLGVLKDLLSLGPFGLETFSLVIGTLWLSILASKFERDSAWTLFPSGFLYAFLVEVLYLYAYGFLEGRMMPAGEIFQKALAASLYLSALIAPAFAVFELFSKTRTLTARHFSALTSDHENRNF